MPASDETGGLAATGGRASPRAAGGYRGRGLANPRPGYRPPPFKRGLGTEEGGAATPFRPVPPGFLAYPFLLNGVRTFLSALRGANQPLETGNWKLETQNLKLETHEDLRLHLP